MNTLARHSLGLFIGEQQADVSRTSVAPCKLAGRSCVPVSWMISVHLGMSIAAVNRLTTGVSLREHTQRLFLTLFSNVHPLKTNGLFSKVVAVFTRLSTACYDGLDRALPLIDVCGFDFAKR